MFNILQLGNNARNLLQTSLTIHVSNLACCLCKFHSYPRQKIVPSRLQVLLWQCFWSKIYLCRLFCEDWSEVQDQKQISWLCTYQSGCCSCWWNQPSRLKKHNRFTNIEFATATMLMKEIEYTFSLIAMSLFSFTIWNYQILITSYVNIISVAIWMPQQMIFKRGD